MSRAPARPTLRGIVWRWGPAAAWAALIFALSAQPGLRLSPDAAVDAPARHLAHVGFYAVLGALVVHGIDGLGRPISWRTVVAAAILTIGYGVTDELHQAFVPDRTAQVADVGYDAVGAAAGVAAAWVLGRARAGRSGGLGERP